VLNSIITIQKNSRLSLKRSRIYSDSLPTFWAFPAFIAWVM